jgi:hypothetical protein
VTVAEGEQQAVGEEVGGHGVYRIKFKG